jgi:hypothetical protein
MRLLTNCISFRALTSDQAALITFPSVNSKDPVRILELSASTMVCPQGFCKFLHRKSEFRPICQNVD